MSQPIAEHTQQNILEQLHQLRQAGSLTRNEQARKTASALDAVLSHAEGIAWLYEHIEEIDKADFFKGTNWEDPGALNVSLVGGTLKSGGLNTVYEIVSELRLLAIAERKIHNEVMSPEAARDFLEELTVINLDLLFPDASEELRNIDDETQCKIRVMFAFLRDRVIEKQRFNSKLADELELICAQRPIVTDRALLILHTLHAQLSEEDFKELDPRLKRFMDAVYAPSPLAREARKRTLSARKFRNERTGTAGTIGLDDYQEQLEALPSDSKKLAAECRALAVHLRETGLSSEFHAVALHRVKDDPSLISALLGLNQYGRAEMESHHELTSTFIGFACRPSTSRFVYGLATFLERNLLSRQPVISGLQHLMQVEVHPEVEAAVNKTRRDSDCTALQHILADTICLLGQPLGVGQGWNPTCQSARGMSLWSRHAPGDVLQKITIAATSNNIAMRFEGHLLQASELPEGLAKDFDYHLDAASVVLVPHLDRIYFEMMRLATGRGEDPHKWVNPAMYGQWIPTGFISPYDYLTNTISGYEHFVRLFYATHHPAYNGNQDLTYPNPVGIFITASNGKLLGFHAVSILRVAQHDGAYRIYFLNPNNEGRQKWQSDILPMVAGNGEVPGESSLPFHQFVSRLYAYHYKPLEVGGIYDVPEDEIQKVVDIAKSSWGESYIWQEIPYATPPPRYG